MNYDVDYFITKFEAIPEELWMIEYFEEVQKDGRITRCALGHCGASDANYSEEAKTLNLLLNYLVAGINDGANDRYQQPTPKQRILAALRDVKAGTFK